MKLVLDLTMAGTETFLQGLHKCLQVQPQHVLVTFHPSRIDIMGTSYTKDRADLQRPTCHVRLQFPEEISVVQKQGWASYLRSLDKGEATLNGVTPDSGAAWDATFNIKKQQNNNNNEPKFVMQDHLLGYVMDGKFWHEFPQNNLVFRLENPKDILQQLDKIVKQRYDGSNSSHTIFPTSDFNQSYAQQGRFYTDDPYNNNNNNQNNNYNTMQSNQQIQKGGYKACRIALQQISAGHSGQLQPVLVITARQTWAARDSDVSLTQNHPIHYVRPTLQNDDPVSDAYIDMIRPVYSQNASLAIKFADPYILFQILRRMGTVSNTVGSDITVRYDPKPFLLAGSTLSDNGRLPSRMSADDFERCSAFQNNQTQAEEVDPELLRQFAAYFKLVITAPTPLTFSVRTQHIESEMVQQYHCGMSPQLWYQCINTEDDDDESEEDLAQRFQFILPRRFILAVCKIFDKVKKITLMINQPGGDVPDFLVASYLQGAHITRIYTPIPSLT